MASLVDVVGNDLVSAFGDVFLVLVMSTDQEGLQ